MTPILSVLKNILSDIYEPIIDVYELKMYDCDHVNLKIGIDLSQFPAFSFLL